MSNHAEQSERLKKMLQSELPSAHAEVVDGFVWVAIGQGENRRIVKLPLEALDASPPELPQLLRKHGLKS